MIGLKKLRKEEEILYNKIKEKYLNFLMMR